MASPRREPAEFGLAPAVRPFHIRTCSRIPRRLPCRRRLAQSPGAAHARSDRAIHDLCRDVARRLRRRAGPGASQSRRPMMMPLITKRDLVGLVVLVAALVAVGLMRLPLPAVLLTAIPLSIDITMVMRRQGAA